MRADRHRLMVVDDEAGVCELIAGVAEQSGYATLHRQSPDTLLADIKDFDPHVLMLDLDLPRTDGVQLLRVLGEHRINQRIVMISGVDARTLDSAQRLGREHGLNMAGVLRKPFPVGELEALLSRLAGNEAQVADHELEQAIAQGEITVHYQPKVSFDAGGATRFHSAEALVRWDHPRLGFIYPDSFIPMAEDCGLILPLTRHVLADAMARIGEWTELGIDAAVAVNLSPLLLGQDELPDEIGRLLAENGVAPRRLTLEITESAAMRDFNRSMEVLTRFRVKGIGLSLDDFGTGYSSLVHLHRLPFNEMKVDRSFVIDMDTNAESRIIVTSIIALGHNLGLSVCAEGVETRGALDALEELGCDSVQGYYIAKPAPPAVIGESFAPAGTDGPLNEKQRARE